VLAQGRWPERPIRLVVPFPPGGNSDVLGRTLADRLREVLPATVVVDNRPGGTTQVGTDAVARAEPDGYTMLLAEPQTRDKLQRASIVAQWTPPDPYRAALHKGRGIYGDLLRSIGMKQDGA
jgi:hypothetical protein